MDGTFKGKAPTYPETLTNPSFTAFWSFAKGSFAGSLAGRIVGGIRPFVNVGPSGSNFTFAPGLNLRCIDKDGAPWFVAKDVCDALAMKSSAGATKWTQYLAEDEKDVAKQRDYRGLPNRGVTIISESGLYALLLRSRKPEAKAFSKWVTSEVLPAIRKNGGYMTPAVAQQAIAPPGAVDDPAVFMAKAAAVFGDDERAKFSWALTSQRRLGVAAHPSLWQICP